MYQHKLVADPGDQGTVQVLAEDGFDVLPLVPRDWLFDAFKRLPPCEMDLVLRHKIVPLIWIPTNTIHAVVSPCALHEAHQKGLKVVARIAVEDYRAAVFHKLGRKLLAKATFDLAKAQPRFSARTRMFPGQMAFLLMFAMLLLLCGKVGGATTVLNALSIIGSGFFALVVGLRAFCLLPDVAEPPPQSPRLPTGQLPLYTILVPMFGETAVLRQLVQSLLHLNYPPEKLDIKIILEESDMEMHRAVHALSLPSNFDVIIVPAGKPQTKPRALNYALQFARGSLLTIYDSEDIPQPNQLRLAAERFAAEEQDMVCLQAALGFYNPAENWLTQQFTAEYASLFKIFLPALASSGLPLLLGGTSNHFRIEALNRCGGWDPFNVTEDADLGIRLSRAGYRSGVLNSNTFEEANPHLGNWLKQRRRWLKGFLQTWLVHMRNPVVLFRQLHASGFWTVQCMTIGIFISAMLHPLLLVHSVWQLLPQQVGLSNGSLITTVAAGSCLAMLAAGYIVAGLAAWLGLRRVGIFSCWKILAGVPAYWLLMSLAAWMALWDFIVAPFHWHKTRHGLSKFVSPDAEKMQKPLMPIGAAGDLLKPIVAHQRRHPRAGGGPANSL